MFIKIVNIVTDNKHMIIDLVIAAKITANVTSVADKGAPTKSTIFPITLPIKIEEEECAKDCEITCIAINPGARNTIN